MHSKILKPSILIGLIGLLAGPARGLAAAPGCQEPPAPTGLTSPGQTPTSVTLRWNPVLTRSNCLVTYDVFLDGHRALTVRVPAAVVGGLGPGSVHFFYVTATTPAGSSAPGVGLALRTPGQ